MFSYDGLMYPAVPFVFALQQSVVFIRGRGGSPRIAVLLSRASGSVVQRIVRISLCCMLLFPTWFRRLAVVRRA